MAITIDKVIEDFDQLTLEEKQYVSDVFRKQLIESRRELIADRVKEATANYETGNIKQGSVEDLYRDLENDTKKNMYTKNREIPEELLLNGPIMCDEDFNFYISKKDNLNK